MTVPVSKDNVIFGVRACNAASEGFYGMRNSYYRWRRARAARKFQVYMGKQGREVHFDKEGRYVDPDDRRRMH